MTELYPYQVEGARFLAEKKRALLADDMGLGKSAQAIAACDAVGAKHIVVVCPASVTENWRREFRKFQKFPRPVADISRVEWVAGQEPSFGGAFEFVEVVSYDKVARDVSTWLAGTPDVLILDEAHYLKNRTAKRTKAIFGPKCDGVGGLVERAKHVFLLTGTPAPNNPAELWPMLRAVLPQAISNPIVASKNTVTHFRPDDSFDPLGVSYRPLAYWSFVNRYCVTRDNGFGIQIVKGKNLAELKTRLAPFVLRRKKNEVLKDLPPIRFAELPVEGRIEFDPDKVEEFAAIVAKALTEHGIAGLAKIAPHVATLRRLTGLAKVAPVVEWVKDWLDGGGQKIVLFAHHRDVIDQLLAGLAEWPGVAVHGGLPPGQRQLNIDAFQNNEDTRFLIGQIQAAGTGITLTAASDVLFVESSWVPADNEQAAMRIHRIGQKNACLVRFAMLAGSIDEQIQRAVMRKTADISRLFG